jgi:Zn-dependent oligopeptidases
MTTVLCAYHHNARILQNCFSLRCLQFSSLILNISQKREYCEQPSPKNPLIDLESLPDFPAVTGDAINEAMPYILAKVQTQHESYERELDSTEDVSWKDVVPKSESILDPLSLAWGAVQHLQGVKDNPSLREALQKVNNF